MLTNKKLNSTPHGWWALVVFLATLFVQTPLTAAPPEGSTPTMRLRVVWASAAPVRWAGRLSVLGGRLADVQLLGRERDTPGSIWLDGGQVLVSQPRPRTFDGFDITVQAPLASTLQVELRAEDDQQPSLVEIPLTELMRESRRTTVTSGPSELATTLVVHRVTADALRVDLQRDSLVCQPGETLRMQVEPALADLEAGGSIDLSAELFRGRGNQREWEHTKRVSLPTEGHAGVPVEVPLPMVDGVYSIKLTASTPPGNRVRFWETATGTKLAERTFQVVVLGQSTSEHYADGGWRTTVEIDPANPKWYSRLSEWTRLDRLTNLGSGPLGSEEARTASMSGHTLVELSASRHERPTWQAYPLPAAQPGKPHIVEVELPTGFDQQLAIRIYEYNSAGKLVPNGPGRGVVVDQQLASKDDSATENCRYLFWPRTRSPVVVIENVREDATGRYGRIRLRVAERGTGQPPTIADRGRMVAASFDWEALVDRTGVRVPNSDGRMPVDDLQTFYQLAERTAALLELSGYNGAVVGVMDGGSAAFDLGDGQSLPVLDTSRLLTGGTDLPAINPTELMLRIFSRRGLRLVPSLRLNASLTAIEAKIRAKKYRSLDEYPVWIDLAGRFRSVVLPELPQVQPYHYRLAHPDVAAEVQAIAQRLAQQCADHAAFAGLAIDFSADSYVACPPSMYGLSRDRLAQVAQSAGANDKLLDVWREKPQKMLADANARRVWNAQRAAEVTAVIKQLAKVVGAARPNARLWVETSQLLEMRELDVRPELIRERSLDDLYLERGLDVATLRNSPGVELPSVWHQTTGLALADAARSLELNERVAMPASSQPGGVAVWHLTSPVSQPLASDFVTPHSLYTPIAFDHLGAGIGMPVAAALHQDGAGSLIIGGPLGPGSLANNRRRTMLRLLTKLPASSAENQSASVEQPVVARVYRSADAAVAMATNDSPWPVAATVTLNVAERTTGLRLTADADNAPAALFSPGTHAWSLKLAPYETQAIEFQSNQVKASSVRVELDPSVEKALAARCKQLESRDLKPVSLPTYEAIANPSFEETDADGLASGWQGAEGVRTASPGVDGSRAAVLQSAGETSSIVTLPFRTPSTGQIELSAQVKVVELSDDSRLNLIVEDAGRRSFIPLTAELLKQNSRAKEWNRYQFGVENLSLNSRGEIRIRIEMTGTGEVWIDDLQLHTLVYPLDVYEEESSQKVLALVQHVKSARRALEAREYAECLDVLDSYWSRFILEHLPEIETPAAESLAPAEATPTESESTPRISDRVKNWFRF